MLSRLLVTIGGAAAWLLLGHFGLLAVLVYVWASAMTSTTNTAKTRALEQRVNNLVSAGTGQNQRISNLSGAATGTGLPAGQPTSGPSINSTSTNGLSSPGITGTSGGASAGTAHTHSAGSYVVGSGQHSHDLESHTHDFDGHTHDLPVV
jgi:hypothetical protein